MPSKTIIRTAALAGIVGPAIFILVFTLEGWLRPGYSPLAQYVSELSLGPRGWIEIVNFLIVGTLMLWFSHGVAAVFSNGRASKAGPLLLAIIGLCLLLSGPFVTDTNPVFAQKSFAGMVHSLLGAVVFTCAPASCFVFYHRFRQDPDWRPLAAWTLVTGIATAIAVIAMEAGQQPGSALYPWLGLIQRAALGPYFIWVIGFAARIRRNVL